MTNQSIITGPGNTSKARAITRDYSNAETKTAHDDPGFAVNLTLTRESFRKGITTCPFFVAAVDAIESGVKYPGFNYHNLAHCQNTLDATAETVRKKFLDGEVTDDALPEFSQSFLMSKNDGEPVIRIEI